VENVPNMDVVESVLAVRNRVAQARAEGQTVGFVPTMGALHRGHTSLMEAARRDCGLVVVSIFVNPTQFAAHEDLDRYPRPKQRDLDLCEQAGAGLVFYPTVPEMYPPGFATAVQVSGLTARWEGALRPTHFQGVATVVTKLLLIVGADRAYFGQKDYQQQAVIRRMVFDLNLPTEIVTCPTIRDADGMAMSSRNAYLSPEQRTAGRCLSRALQRAEAAWQRGEDSPAELTELLQQTIRSTPGAELDYAVVVDPNTLEPLVAAQPVMTALVACRVGTTRLIDNAIWSRADSGNSVEPHRLPGFSVGHGGRPVEAPHRPDGAASRGPT
jgi:pantoate--beta-alanine ligase